MPNVSYTKKYYEEERSRITLLLKKIKPNGKTQEMKVRCRKTPTETYMCQWGNHPNIRINCGRWKRKPKG